MLLKAFVMSQFSNRSLIWMFLDRNLNEMINRMHKSGRRIAYKDNVSSFENLSLMDNMVTFYQMNLQLLVKEICKTRHGPSAGFVKQIFEERLLPYIHFKNNTIRLSSGHLEKTQKSYRSKFPLLNYMPILIQIQIQISIT